MCGRNQRKKKTKALNVSILLDNTKANRPDRRTLLVARKLDRYKVDIAISPRHASPSKAS